MSAFLQLYTFDVAGRAGYLFSDRALVTPSNTTSLALVKVTLNLGVIKIELLYLNYPHLNQTYINPLTYTCCKAPCAHKPLRVKVDAMTWGPSLTLICCEAGFIKLQSKLLLKDSAQPRVLQAPCMN